MSFRTICGNQQSFNTFFLKIQRHGVQQRLGFRYLKTGVVRKKTLLAKISETLFGRYLLPTNIVSSGVLMVIGDTLAQEIEYRRNLAKERCDFKRMGQMFLVGTVQGPMHHFFYKWIDTILPVVSMGAVIKKIALDQLIMSPACITLFFYSAGSLEGKTLRECSDELKAKFLTIYTVDWMVWPFAQFCNFYWLHPRYRVLYVNLVTMMYNIFLSYVKHDESSEITQKQI